jgi:hypothetical protein
LAGCWTPMLPLTAVIDKEFASGSAAERSLKVRGMLAAFVEEVRVTVIVPKLPFGIPGGHG